MVFHQLATRGQHSVPCMKDATCAYVDISACSGMLVSVGIDESACTGHGLLGVSHDGCASQYRSVCQDGSQDWWMLKWAVMFGLPLFLNVHSSLWCSPPFLMSNLIFRPMLTKHAWAWLQNNKTFVQFFGNGSSASSWIIEIHLRVSQFIPHLILLSTILVTVLTKYL